ncbi:hypothetical protein [Wocania ichthyoenteri]|uniref:hypothetical protein n=1 Tax=Wocania ichthyoenteri TaxID=1230531 RepID=UPI00053D56D2|nr:hypothetical protein [Wocania ichthyoenteri]
MKIEDSEYYKTLNPFKLEMPFGNYYFFEKFIVGELFESIHFDWKKAELLIAEVLNFYGEHAQLGFIANRINHYSVDPQNWVKLEKKYNFISASAIVMYNMSTYMNASIEKQFAKKSIKRCTSLHEAIEWIINLKEFN